MTCAHARAEARAEQPSRERNCNATVGGHNVLEILKGLPRGIDGVKALGRVSKEDYERVIEPLFEDARCEGRRIRFLYEFGPDFDGFTPGAAWEDFKMGLSHMRRFDGCAIVSDIGWIRESAKLFGFVMPCPVRVFGNQERAMAVEWLASLPQGAAVSHRILPEAGVMVVEIEQALRAQDFDSVAAAADGWIDAHGDLRGLVIQARTFPRWENLGSFFRHVRFVRDQTRRIPRVAFVTDSSLGNLTPRIAEHFVQTEVKHFAYDAINEAIQWARGPVDAA
jgi:SpoIIAA-like